MSSSVSFPNTIKSCTTLFILLFLTGLAPVYGAYDATFYQAISAYEQGRMVRAFKLFRQAAAAGNREAQYNLAVLYLNGQGTRRDPARARHWLKQAANRNHARAAWSLGKLIMSARRVSFRKMRRAMHWYRLAARLGHADSMYQLGSFYTMGKGVRANQSQAARWYVRAAENGHATAQLHTARLYFRGYGIQRHLPKAWAWCRLAQDQGQRFAARNCRMIRHQLGLTQRSAARYLLRRFRKLYLKPRTRSH